MQGENKHPVPIFIFQFFNVLHKAVSFVKFEKNLDITIFSKDLLNRSFSVKTDRAEG